MVDIPVNIKDYIVQSRKSGIPDSKIFETLKTANWPEDIISSAMQEANGNIQSVPEPVQEPNLQNQNQTNIVGEKSVETKETQPLDNVQTQTKEIQNDKPKKTGFCFLTLIALLCSPIPFIGLGLAMTSFDIIKKKNKTGTLIAVLALIINIAAILFVFYIIVQLLTLNPTELEGISLYIVEKFNIL